MRLLIVICLVVLVGICSAQRSRQPRTREPRKCAAVGERCLQDRRRRVPTTLSPQTQQTNDPDNDENNDNNNTEPDSKEAELKRGRRSRKFHCCEGSTCDGKGRSATCKANQ